MASGAGLEPGVPRGALAPNLRNRHRASAFAASLCVTAAAAQTTALKLDHAQVENIVQGLDIVLHVYAPALEKMQTWKAPNAVLMK